jgi:hypothetical protein
MNKSLPMIKKLQTIVALAAICMIPVLQANAQGGCIEIRSILVDACGTPEGENEMVRFDVGPNALNTANMIVDWPNNAFQGLCQDANTAALVASVNQNIVGCGSLVEPVGGVLPANSKVLLLTSVNINTIANTFANLNDDVIVLFQCAGNTSGHFANSNVLPGLRTLAIEFTGACLDSVTYDRTLLVNQYGAIGGFTFENDGAFVEFTSGGAATYLNYGCQALSTGLSLTAGPDAGICPGASNIANLSGNAVNMVGNPQWNGGTGTFSNPTSLTTTYTPGPGESGIIFLTLTGNGPCAATITDTVRVNIVTSLPAVSISSSVSGQFSSSVTDPTYFYNWYPDGSTTFIPGAFAPTFTPNTNGCYYMILSTVGGCNVTSNVLCITNVGLADLNSETYMDIYGNPGNNPWLALETATPANEVNVAIIDLYGRVISSTDLTMPSGEFEIRPDWTSVAAGIYMVRVSSSDWKVEGKVVLTK